MSCHSNLKMHSLADALNTVEQDHQLVLDRMQALKELVAALTAPGTGHPPRKRYVAEALRQVPEERL